MRWQDMRRSENVEDRRGQGPARGGGGFGGGMRIGLGGLVIALIASFLFGINPLEILTGMGSGPAPAPGRPPPGYGPQVQPGTPAAPKQGDTAGAMMQAVLGNTEDVWLAVFEAQGWGKYPKPNLVLFDGRIASACGLASAAVGPFYCPTDRKVYLDTAFFGQLAQRFGAPGDFAAAYVVAHEIGHHVQNALGVMQKLGPRPDNETQVRLELQADCFAGVWGFYAMKRKLLEPGDLEEGLRAAAAVGDDMIMKRTQGYVVPDAFTHGSAQQRQRWFRQGLATGDPRQCDTFGVRQP
jgi:predicted metalloprotease